MGFAGGGNLNRSMVTLVISTTASGPPACEGCTCCLHVIARSGVCKVESAIPCMVEALGTVHGYVSYVIGYMGTYLQALLRGCPLCAR
jgi:hypothetical protein